MKILMMIYSDLK